jgi:hypothetical protein
MVMERLTSKPEARPETTAERRKAQRHRPHARVSWRVLGDRDSRGTAELKDISTHGLALIADRSCKAGTVLVVELQGAADAEPMLLRAEWVKQQSGNKWQIGCSLTSSLTEQELRAFFKAAQTAAEQPAPAESRAKPTADPFVVGSVRERRAAPRRSGLAVPVLLSRAEGGVRMEAFVSDRSLTGLGILIHLPFARGTQLTVRPRNGNDKSPSVKLQVRTCRQKGKHWLLGCQFLKSPPANVLLLFG